MALKGTATIELTNVKTGEKEVYKEDNLVTNAVASILDNPFAWQLKTYNSVSYFGGNMLPLCPNLFGGILLYESAIPEDENQLYAQSDNVLMGYSSINVNDGTDVMRGSMNQTESGPLETNDGYRFVFDFETSQANGRIACVCMTSKWGGMAGNGSSYLKNTQSPCVYAARYNISDKDLCYALATLLHYDADTGIATSMYVSGQNMITVTRFKLHTKLWKLVRRMDLADATQVVDTQFIDTKVFAGATVSGSTLYYNLCDGGDGYIWGFEHADNAKGNASDNASINWIKIKVDDLTFEEGTWTIDGQMYWMGERTNGIFSYASTRYVDEANCVVLDGYLYCLNYELTGVYKIKLSNPTDIVFIEHPSEKITIRSSYSNNYYYYFSTANLVVAGKRVCMWNGWVNGESIIPNKVSVGMPSTTTTLQDGWIETGNASYYPLRNNCGLHGINIGVFKLYISATRSGGGSYSEATANLILDSPYLATINNLAAPVEKTADKTMKITYILREE